MQQRNRGSRRGKDDAGKNDLSDHCCLLNLIMQLGFVINFVFYFIPQGDIAALRHRNNRDNV